MYSVLQRIGKSFMLPVALLPALGILLGVGGSFSDKTFYTTYHLEALMGPGTFLYAVFFTMSKVGVTAFQNLPTLFAIGIAVGMAKSDKGTAALAAFMGFFVLHTTIGALLDLNGITIDASTKEFWMKKGLAEVAAIQKASGFTTTLGVFTYNMSVVGGIIVGLTTAALHNKFFKTQLPDILGFFSGSRLVPIIVSFSMVLMAAVLYFVWPFLQIGISSLGSLVHGSGYVGTFLFGFIWRSLCSIGLHHAFYLPFWETQIGGSAMIGGKEVIGAHNIVMLSLTDPVAKGHFNQFARFTSYNYMWMLFGMPGVAYAMTHTALPENKKSVASIVYSAAATSVITGITEPIEFLFLFVAPGLYYGFHAVINGLCAVLTQVLNIGVGTSFSCGIIDLTLFGILPGFSTNWYYIILIGWVFFPIYYFVFKSVILKFDLKTPGRGGDSDDAIIAGAQKGASANKAKTDLGMLSEKIVEELGGYKNLASVDACATKLRIEVVDVKNITKDTEVFKRDLQALGYVQKGNGVQIAYGTRASLIAGEINETMGQ